MSEGSSGNGANPLHDFCFKSLFFETGHFKQEKTGQFSRVPLTVKMGRINWSCGTLGMPGGGITAEKYRGFLIGKTRPGFSGKMLGDLPFLCFWQAREGIQMVGCSGFEGVCRRCQNFSAERALGGLRPPHGHPPVAIVFQMVEWDLRRCDLSRKFLHLIRSFCIGSKDLDYYTDSYSGMHEKQELVSQLTQSSSYLSQSRRAPAVSPTG